MEKKEMKQPKILAFAGSTRTDSFNKNLVNIAATGAREAGADITIIDLRDYPMPLYDEDLEKKEGVPSSTLKLKELMLSHHGFLISSPEYNSSISGVLKNTFDWTSRQGDDKSPMSCFKDKVAGIMSASPGGLGGLRGLVHVRSILENMGVMVIPNQVAISKAHEVFNSDNSLRDPKQEEKVKSIGIDLTKLLQKLHS